MTAFRHRPQRAAGPRRLSGSVRPAAAIVLGLLALLVAACAEESVDELKGPFGPGAGGPPVGQGTLVTVPLVTADGQPLGSLAYDDGYFTANGTPGVLVLQNAGDGVTLVATPISGRPDTPCRFNAAVLARDEDYTILAAGDRTNAQGLEFHEVDLVRGATFQRFYCTESRPPLGVQLNGISEGGNALGSLQVHFVLNSVAP